jgi:hypothetical protein
VREIARPRINRDIGSTLAFSKVQARTLTGWPRQRGRAAGSLRRDRRALTIGDLHQNRGFDASTRWRSTRRLRRGYVARRDRPVVRNIQASSLPRRSIVHNRNTWRGLNLN